MAQPFTSSGEPGDRLHARNRNILLTYTCAIFVSALLLFSVQPLFTKMVLPRLGGSPAVWSVAMVFFQSLLLGGYLYAHFLTQLANRTFATVVHVLLLLAALSTLPLAIAGGWDSPPTDGAEIWLLGLFLVSIGLPFFALSANNPLLQAWFVRTGHPDGADPYFLYASSNIGSFLALLSYPVLLEPFFTLRAQNLIWTSGYVLLVILIMISGVLLLRSPKGVAPALGDAAHPADVPSWTLRLRWIFLAAVPSGLLIAVTAHISTDVAAAPLLWVLPLALYLLTWVIVFQQKPVISHSLVLLAQPFAIAGVAVLFFKGIDHNILVSLAAQLLCFFVIALACHGELARTRPAPQFLTGFYVAMSFGGMVGGLFAGLAAPYLFSWIAEYPILLALSVLCRPLLPERWAKASVWLWGLIIAIAILALLPLIGKAEWRNWYEVHRLGLAAAIMTVAVIVTLAFNATRYKLAAFVVIVLVMMRLYPAEDGRIETVRSFFGVHKIQTTSDNKFRVLLHGTTIHGAERLLNDDGTPVTGRPEPITYYHRDGGMGNAISALREAKGRPLKVAVIGLGTGSLACASEPGESWRYFEIDQSMIDTARDPKYFRFISACDPQIQTVVGDARLTFAREPDGAYDAVIVDAYSSDAIPIHLATAEAMAIYKAKLAPGGAVIVHVSNRHLELASVIVGIADRNGLMSWVFDENSDRGHEYIFDTSVVVSANSPRDVGEIADSQLWTLTKPDADQQVWTDDYSNIPGALWRQIRNRMQ